MNTNKAGSQTNTTFPTQSNNTETERDLRWDLLDAGTFYVLLALARAGGYSLNAHVPSQAIASRFSRSNRGYAKKTLRKILRTGLAIRHPTEGGMTFQLTKTGLRMVRAINCFEELSEMTHESSFSKFRLRSE